MFHNKYLVGAFVLGVILQAGIVCVPALTEIFSIVPLNGVQWMMVAGVSVLPIVIVELQKKANEVIFGKPVYGYKEVKGV